ncbi:MAG TPA: TIGR03435 family protein [Acidobacteriaceae bacterium]|nr:TIGR03435 family protein [Acidobacteriaceae bacterium]
MPLPEFHRKSLLFTAALTFIASPLLAQSAAPSFDVATVKQHQGMISMIGVVNTPDGVKATASLPMLVQYAYGLPTSNQIAGTPDWGTAATFDVQAKMSAADIEAMGKMTPAEQKAFRASMMRSLLAERFKLKTHSESKPSPVYELVVAKGGPKMSAATSASQGIRFQRDTSKVMDYSMEAFAEFLSSPATRLGRPVIDKTGLTGKYDFDLNWSVYMTSPEDQGVIFGALGEVGLKLQSATDPVETVFIDHAEQPAKE